MILEARKEKIILVLWQHVVEGEEVWQVDTSSGDVMLTGPFRVKNPNNCTMIDAFGQTIMDSSENLVLLREDKS